MGRSWGRGRVGNVRSLYTLTAAQQAAHSESLCARTAGKRNSSGRKKEIGGVPFLSLIDGSSMQVGRLAGSQLGP